jgi:ABC-type cobalamin/Fe3+-siderophores transport system ATPase subunit
MGMLMKDKFKFLIKLNHKALCILGSSGSGKSAIVKEIADDLGWNFIDIRMIGEDHAEANGYPFRTQKEFDKRNIEVMKKAVPEWAYMANQKECIVCFDEFNRALKETMDGLLQVIHDRRIGYEFNFNDNVHFVLIGNLGEEDECDVNMFDRAVLGRLHIEKHNLSLSEWKENFAIKKVNSYIISFLDSNPDFFYKINANDKYAYASPRSWDSLSRLLGKDNSNIADMLEKMENFGVGEIGGTAADFMNYLREIDKFNINDILDNFEKMNSAIKNMNRGKQNSLLKELEKVNIDKLTEIQFKNLIKFLKIVDPDELTAYISYVVDTLVLLDDKSEKLEGLSDNLNKLRKTFESITNMLILDEMLQKKRKRIMNN